MADNRSLANLATLLSSHIPASAQPKKRLPAAANDNSPRLRDVLAWPTLERLAHKGDALRVNALRHWRNLVHPGIEYSPTPADDSGGETAVEIRPGEAELLTAIGWTVTARVRCPETGELVNEYEVSDVQPSTERNRNGGTDTTIGRLKFRDGALIEWGRTKKGAALRPVERPRGIKGEGTPAGRTDASIWAYLRLPVTTRSPFEATSLPRPFSASPRIRDCYEPLRRQAPTKKDRHGRYGVEEARALLQEFGVDGAVPFGQLPPGAVLLRDGLVAGPQWVGGVKKPKPTGEISAAAVDQARHENVETRDYLAFLRTHLGNHARVLDMAITDASAKEIAVAMGKAPGYAEKAGPLIINAAIDALLAIDDTARDATVHKIAA